MSDEPQSITAHREARWRQADAITARIPEEVRWTRFDNADGTAVPVYIKDVHLRAIVYQVLELTDD